MQDRQLERETRQIEKQISKQILPSVDKEKVWDNALTNVCHKVWDVFGNTFGINVRTCISRYCFEWLYDKNYETINKSRV